MRQRVFFPKLITCLKEISPQTLFSDLSAGFIVALVALPLAIAFGVASGVSPKEGLATAIIAGFIIALLGGSRVSVSGPTGAFVVIVAGIVSKFGVHGLMTATVMAGVLLILMGIAKCGRWIQFVPFPVITAFTSGIAAVIFIGQLQSFFGLKLAPSEPLQTLYAVSLSLKLVDIPTLFVSLLSLALLLTLPKILPKVPPSFAALVIVASIVWWFQIPTETIGTRFGEIPARLPNISWIDWNWEEMRAVAPSAVTIAMLGAIESLLCAVVADGMIGGQSRPNTELIGQGIGNVLSPLFGGIPATGALARTAVNVRSGAKTPLAAIFHAIFLLVIVLYCGSLAAYIPMATLSAILITVAWRMGDWKEFFSLFKSAKKERLVLAATFTATLLFDLVVAVQIGLFLSFFLFISSMSEKSELKKFEKALSHPRDPDTYYQENPMREVTIPADWEVFDVSGALFFAALSKFEERVKEALSKHQMVILRMEDTIHLDVSALKMLLELEKEALKSSKKLIFCQASKELQSFLSKELSFGDDLFFKTLEEVIEKWRT